MDNSLEATRSDNSPLLRDSVTPTINDEDTQVLIPRVSIFSCAVVCILFTELCERLTFYGIGGNLVLFATEKDHLDMSPALASILVYVFQGTCFAMPILGGWLADSKAGKFSVIFCSAIIYLFGTMLLPLGSITKSGKEHSDWAAVSVTTNPAFKKAVYIGGLFLVAFGTGGIKANVSPFGAEQVSNRGPAAIQAFFSWFYWFINIGALLAFTVVVYIQQNISYFWGNLIPVFSLVLALIIFLSGRRTYNLRSPAGSVLSTTMNIAKEAIKKSRHPSLSSSFVNHWLDRAKMCYGGSYSSWEVEDVKKVYRLLPIFATFILYWTVYAQMNTSMIYQGEYTDIKIGSFYIPIASLSILDTLGVLLLIPIMDKLIYPLLAKFDIRPTQLQRIGLGMLISMASMVCAGGIELYRVDQCCMSQQRPGDEQKNVSSISVFYQVPQYALIGLSEVFTSITGLELAYTESPKALQGVIMGVYLLTTGLGTFVGAALVAIVNAATGKIGENADEKWYPDTKYINKGKLAYYFFLLAGLMFLNFILYVFVAFSYKAKKESANRANLNNGNMNPGSSHEVPSDQNKTERETWSNSHDRPPRKV